jgi:hypothetical protein
LAIKIILALFTKVINPDGVLYITAAQHFASGDFKAGLAIYPMPAYSLSYSSHIFSFEIG